MSSTTSGSLARYPLPRLLCFLQKKLFTGVLWLDTSPAPREVLFHQGIPLGLSAGTGEALLKLLSERGRIPTGAVPALMAKLDAPGVDMEALLSAQAAIDASEVERALRYVVFQGLVALFHERSAPFSLTAKAVSCATDSALRYAVEPLFLVHQGVLAAYDEERLLGDMAVLKDQAIRARAGMDETVSRFGLGEGEALPLKYLRQGFWSLTDLVEALPGQRLSALRVAYVLLSAEALDIAPADSVPRLRPKRPETDPRDPPGSHDSRITASRAAAPRPGAPKERPGNETEPLVKPPPTPASGSFSNLNPLPSPGAGDAMDRLSPRPGPTPQSSPVAERAARPPITHSGMFATARLAPKVVRDARETAKRVRDVIGDRQETIALLDELVSRLESMDGQNPFEQLGLKLDANVGEVKQAYMLLVKRLHPDRLEALGLGAMGEASDALFKRLTEAHQALSDGDRLAEARRIYSQAVEGHDPEAARRAIEAEVDFQKGEVYFRKGDLAKAEQHFLAAVEGNPEEGEHLALLAWTRYQTVAMELRGEHRQSTLEMLERAIALSPRCARAHYFLGKLTLEERRVDAALQAFRRAASLKRSYIEAEREIRIIEMRQRGGHHHSGKSSIFNVFKRGKK